MVLPKVLDMTSRKHGKGDLGFLWPKGFWAITIKGESNKDHHDHITRNPQPQHTKIPQTVAIGILRKVPDLEALKTQLSSLKFEFPKGATKSIIYIDSSLSIPIQTFSLQVVHCCFSEDIYNSQQLLQQLDATKRVTLLGLLHWESLSFELALQESGLDPQFLEPGNNGILYSG